MTELTANLIQVLREKGVKAYSIKKPVEDKEMVDVIFRSSKNDAFMGYSINPNNIEKPYTFVSHIGEFELSLEDVKEFMHGFALGDSLLPDKGGIA